MFRWPVTPKMPVSIYTYMHSTNLLRDTRSHFLYSVYSVIVDTEGQMIIPGSIRKQ